ncbi:MAG: radical SAM protein [Coriobacteriales bacterium]|nr:radical SAM protein [Coriobacteriales bacterium]
MRYILNGRYRFRGWKKAQTGVYDAATKTAKFLNKKQYLMLLRCDGAHDLDEQDLSEEDKKFFEELLNSEVIRPARLMELLHPVQSYKEYPAEYRKSVQWSITGACNLKCRHCFMSAPHAKHGAPSHEQIIAIADQLAECGIFQVSLTGGEPLIREDFLDIIDALNEREIGIDTIYTNGWLVDEAFLDDLDKHHVHPPFQLSFDGVGWHDFLRGVPGAEDRTISALKLLQKRGCPVSISMCMHRKNRHTLRKSINLLASLGVRSVKCGSMMQLGEWAQPELHDLQLTKEEELQMFEEYIPQYFEDDAPVSLMLGGVFMYDPGDPMWNIFFRRECAPEDERLMPSCGILTKNFYIGAEGMVCPCMGMGDCGYAKNFPNLFETPLREILDDSDFTHLCQTKVGDIRDANPQCRECKYLDRCTGGCRNSALMAGDNYCGIDPEQCWFFEHNGEERIAAAAKDAFEAYIRRHPPTNGQAKPADDAMAECP